MRMVGLQHLLHETKLSSIDVVMATNNYKAFLCNPTSNCNAQKSMSTAHMNSLDGVLLEKFEYVHNIDPSCGPCLSLQNVCVYTCS